MRRRATAVLGAVLLVVLGACSADPVPDGGGERFVAASLDLVRAPAKPAPEPEIEPAVSRTMFAAATLQTFAGPLDACRGPVAIDVQEQGRPVLVSEHDYCGGAGWIPSLGDGDVVELDGPGVEKGLYEVSTVDTHQRRQVYVSDLRTEADVVLQTCTSATTLVLVALRKVGESAA